MLFDAWKRRHAKEELLRRAGGRRFLLVSHEEFLEWSEKMPSTDRWEDGALHFLGIASLLVGPVLIIDESTR